MKPYGRYLLALLIVVGDFLLFAVPIMALVTAYILIVRPPAFQRWITKLYESQG